MYYFSLSSGGFYSKDITGDNMPDDVLPITAEQRTYLQDGLSRKMVIWLDDSGELALKEPLPYKPNKEEISATRRQSYSDPVTGSDRFFVQAARMQAMGLAGWENVVKAGVERFKEIQKSIPWD